MVLPLIMACGMAPAQPKPNFAGNALRAAISSGPVWESRLDRISVDGVNLKDTIAQSLGAPGRRAPTT